MAQKWEGLNAEQQLSLINKELNSMTVEVKNLMAVHNESMLKLAQQIEKSNII